MTKDKQLQIVAQDYIDMHKNDSIDNWQPWNIFDLDQKLLIIGNNLLSGVYGDVRENDGVYEIEIRGAESCSGNPIIFEFEV
jgi:hypothetical protein